VRLERLEVRDFRGIRAATIEFGPGVTVLHGPNELGKSTLVEAIHAALFLQSTSQAGNEHVTWGGSSPACVTLTFEHGAKLWRVSKRFGKKGSAKLECSGSVASPKFKEVVEGKGVEGELRKLLGWGIAPPGGKGPAPKAESFLLTALVGRQGAVQGVLNSSLGGDSDDTGKSLVTQAIGALDKDPLVSRIVEQLAERVETVFTPQGKPKTAADSPVVKLQDQLREKQDVLRKLQEDDARGKSIQTDVVRLQDERQRLEDDLHSARTNLDAANAQAERVSIRAKLQAEIDDLRRQLDEAEQLTTELRSLDDQLVAAQSSLETLKVAEKAAADALEATRVQLMTAAGAVAHEKAAAEQSGQVKEANRAKRRAELETDKMTAEARLKEVTAAKQTVYEATVVEQQFKIVADARDSAIAAVERAERTFEHATVRTALEQLIERETAVTRAAGQLGVARQYEQDARGRLQTAAAGVADAEARRDQRLAESNSDEIKALESELLLLQAVDALIVIEALRAEVQALEEKAAEARTLRERAQSARSDASSIDQRLASRVLPTSEQIAAWRTLEEELKVGPTIAPTSPSSPLTPVLLASVGVLVAVAAATRVGFGLPLLTAVLAGLVAAGVLGGAIWVGLQGRVRAGAAGNEQSARRRDQWTQQVKPSLLAADLTKLADYEGAVADVQRQRAEAQRLRQQADQDDRDAGEAQSSAAPLESRREVLGRLESEAPAADPDAVSAGATAFGNDVHSVRRRISEVQAAIEATRGRLRADADAAVKLATDNRIARQTEYGTAAKALTAAETTLALAEQQSDPEQIARLRTRLAGIGDVDAPEASVEAASKALGEAKTRHTTDSTTADMLSGQLDEQRSAVERRVNLLGGDLVIAHQQAQQSLDAITAELIALDLPDAGSDSGGSELERATKEDVRLEEQSAADKTTLESATKQRSDAEGDLKALETDAATLRGKLTVVDRPALESRLQKATGDPVWGVAEGPPVDPAATRATVKSLQDRRQRCTDDLNHTKGQLHLIAGHVGSERLAQQEEVVKLTRAELLERELTEHAARRLLIEIEKVEAERATHLGHALAGPITEQFRALTGGRYGPISLDPDLKTTHIEVQGAAQQLDHLSVGTREQLATLLRLAIAGYLKTALVLDDQLVHSDPERLNWFRDRLRASAVECGHQVIVFTCRPSDYLSPDGQVDDSVAVVDLTVQVPPPTPP
jgi:hypothetical protein